VSVRRVELILAIDGGGTRTRCLAIDREGKVLGEQLSGPSNHLLVDPALVRSSLHEAIGATLSQAGFNQVDVACVSAGTAGVDFDGAGAAEIEIILQELGFPRTLVNGDMVIAHAGALGLDPGVVALAGTGSVILGINRDGKRVKVGGWGPVFGDEGSAYRIGQMALRAGAEMYDGRKPPTDLLKVVLRALGISQFRETISRVYLDAMEPREIAALTPLVYEVAQAGDVVARSIFFKAAEELADGIQAAFTQGDFKEKEIFISYQGSVLESCALLRERMIEELSHRQLTFKFLKPRFSPVVGAYLLGRKALGWGANNDVLADLQKSLSLEVVRGS